MGTARRRGAKILGLPHEACTTERERRQLWCMTRVLKPVRKPESDRQVAINLLWPNTRVLPLVLLEIEKAAPKNQKRRLNSGHVPTGGKLDAASAGSVGSFLGRPSGPKAPHARNTMLSSEHGGRTGR